MTTVYEQLTSGPYAAPDSKTIFLADDGHLNDEIGPKKEKKTRVSHGGLKYHEVFPKKPKGMTTLAFVYKEGVMVAIDHSDASMDDEYFVENAIDLDSHVIVTVSGVGDTRSFLKNLRDRYQHEHGSEEGRKSVLEVPEWVAKHLSLHHDKDSSAKMLIAMWDHETKSPRLFSVDANGQRSVQKGVTGCGSQIVRSLLGTSLFDKVYAEAMEYAKWAIDATVFGLSFVVHGAPYEIVVGRHISGYYVAADGWKRAFYNEHVSRKSLFEQH